MAVKHIRHGLYICVQLTVQLIDMLMCNSNLDDNFGSSGKGSEFLA
jgi:hypothetical protein